MGNRVHFRMDGAETILLDFAVRRFGFVNQAANVRAVRHSCGRAVVSSREDTLVPDYDSAHFCPGASRALRHLAGNRQKILVP